MQSLLVPIIYYTHAFDRFCRTTEANSEDGMRERARAVVACGCRPWDLPT